MTPLNPQSGTLPDGGYTGQPKKLLESHGIAVGDYIKVTSDMEYTGTLMPRYEGVADTILVLKLPNGYNIGVDAGMITSLKRMDRDAAAVTRQTPPRYDAALPKVLLISTGGTIASRIDYRTGAVTPVVSPEDLSALVPELAELAQVHTEVLFAEYSENMQPQHWTEIAKRLDQISGSDYSGIVIAHGTDTIHYTSAFLSFALSGYPIPVALVGSQRSSDRPSSDAALNLVGAVKFLTRHAKSGIYVVMHHTQSDSAIACHYGTRVRKMHTSRRDAFQTIGSGPACIIHEDKITGDIHDEFFDEPSYSPRVSIDSRVALLKYHPGYDPSHMDYLVDSGVKVIILEGTGLGHVGRTLYSSIERASRNGVFLGMTSQCISGRTRMTVYESGRDLTRLGVVPLHDMVPEVALVKAMWALGCAKDDADFERLMLSRIASEYTV